jgi:hypothetical protein
MLPSFIPIKDCVYKWGEWLRRARSDIASALQQPADAVAQLP